MYPSVTFEKYADMSEKTSEAQVQPYLKRAGVATLLRNTWCRILREITRSVKPVNRAILNNTHKRQAYCMGTEIYRNQFPGCSLHEYH